MTHSREAQDQYPDFLTGNGVEIAALRTAFDRGWKAALIGPHEHQYDRLTVSSVSLCRCGSVWPGPEDEDA